MVAAATGSPDAESRTRVRLETPADAAVMREEIQLLQAQYRSLQELVGELLVTNQHLRLQLAQCKPADVSAPATHPQPRRES